MSNSQAVGSKLANSVRQAKQQQTQTQAQDVEKEAPQKPQVATTAKKEAAVPYLMSSNRVWPD